MEILYIYLIKSSGLFLLFFLAYHFMLRKETFFISNRWFLLFGLLTSALLPLLVFTKVIWVEPTPINIDWSNIPVTATVEEDHTKEYIYLTLVIAYCLGIIGLLAKFGFDFYSLRGVFKGKVVRKQADFKFIDVEENLAPFSFYNIIVYNSALYSSAELESIIEHEKVHSKQHHTTDVLISRLFCIVFWFNPVVWLYKKAILQNLEFIADREASKKISDKKAYQITLLKITTQKNCIAITNHFYQSLIKKRIVMLNKNQSNKRNSWKYFSVVPMLIAFMFLFQIKVIAQEKENEFNITNGAMKVELHVTSNSTEKELNAEKEFFKKEFDLEMSFSKIKTNKSNEIIAIKVELKDKQGVIKINQISGQTPIKPFDIFAEIETDNTLNFGFSNSRNKESKDYSNIKNAKSGIDIKKEKTFYTVDNFKKNGVDYLMIINGIKQIGENRTKIPLDEGITSFNILDPEIAIVKYGEEGKNGVVEVITKKARTFKGDTPKNKDINANTEIYIDGKKATKKEIDSTNVDDIKTMSVSKDNNTPTIYITTKGSTDGKARIFDYKIPAIELGLEKTDPTNLNSLQKSKTNYTIKKVSIEKDGGPDNIEYFIDGKRVSPLEANGMSPNFISSVDVNKDATSNKNAIRIITKSYIDGKKNDKIEIPTKNEDKG